MKILRIIARLNVGGPARHVVWLTRELQTDEFESVLIAGSVPEGEADMSYFAAENGVKPLYIEEMSRELSPKDVFALYKVYRRIRMETPDIIHTHTAKAGTVGRQAAFLYRWLTWGTLVGRPRPVKIVHTFHGHVFHSYYGKFKTGIFLLIEKLLARFATDRIVVISDQQMEEIHEHFGIGRREQFHMIPLGIDLSLFRDNTDNRGMMRDAIGAAKDDIIIGFVGRLTEIKNIPLLLKAASIYIDSADSSKPKLKFVIAGDGHLRNALEAEAKSLGLGETLEFLGHRSDITNIISAMDIVALTSWNEGTPLSLIEAMAVGVPVVSTAVGGVVDLLGDTVEVKENFSICERGIAVESGSPESVSNGLIYLAKDEKLRESLGRAGRKFVSSEYSKDRLTADIRRLYRDLADENRVVT